ncbi:MAG: DUF465 domain-containing protein [Deltaproteobacteria bacterium]|nr:MAG: DUF465 domain-containing protein [Deltaproteobacteria bacterium]
MALKDEEIIERLMAEDSSFRQMKLQHLEYEKQLEDYLKKSYLTPAEQQEVHRLKKMKLALKDKMYREIVEYRKREEGA